VANQILADHQDHADKLIDRWIGDSTRFAGV